MPIQQIDWRTEFDAIRPYLDGQDGIVRIEFSNNDCAPNHFSSLLKQKFAGSGGLRFSIRIDHDFATTHVAHDIIEEFEVQLARHKIEFEKPQLPSQFNAFNDIHSGENTTINIGSVSVGGDTLQSILKQRGEALCIALEKFVDSGGRFLIEHRDAPVAWHKMFIRHIWDPILSRFAGRGLFYVQMIGPKCDGTAPEDMPTPDLIRALPTGFETDESRENDAYDDLIDIFEAEGYSREAASAAAVAHLNNNLKSVAKMHNNLAGVLLSLKRRQAD